MDTQKRRVSRRDWATCSRSIRSSTFDNEQHHDWERGPMRSHIENTSFHFWPWSRFMNLELPIFVMNLSQMCLRRCRKRPQTKATHTNTHTHTSMQWMSFWSSRDKYFLLIYLMFDQSQHLRLESSLSGKVASAVEQTCLHDFGQKLARSDNFYLFVYPRCVKVVYCMWNWTARPSQIPRENPSWARLLLMTWLTEWVSTLRLFD